MRHCCSFLLCIILIFCSQCLFATNAYLTNIRIIKADKLTRINFSLTHPVPQQTKILQNPDRIVIDFDKTELAEHLKNLRLPTNEVRSITSKKINSKKLRLILNLKQTAHLSIMPNAMSNRYVLDIDIKNIPTKSAKHDSSILPFVTKPPIKNPITTVVIDAGHGGKDPGAIGLQGTNEKDVVLAISKLFAYHINQQPNMRAVLTRKDDYFVHLRDRLKLARKGKADLFISIHADSYFNKSARGASVYTLSHRGATSEAARWLAKRENYSELGGVEFAKLGTQSILLRSVLIDLAQTASLTDGMRLGSAVLKSLDELSELRSSHLEQAPFVVLKSPDIPSILVETGYISNPAEEARLKDPKYQNQLAKALTKGVLAYLKKYPPAG